MIISIGLFFILFGIVSLLWGDVQITDERRGGIIQKFFSTSPVVAKWRKWVIGLAAIYVGVMILESSSLF